MGSFIDRTGVRYGRLTCIKRVPNNPTSNFINGHTKSCGCLKKGRNSTLAKDLTGQRFRRLKVIKWVGNKKQFAYWLCRCDCGKIMKLRGTSLSTGHTSSCGCYQRDITSERMRKRKRELNPNWNPNLTDEERLIDRSTQENRTWGKDVFKRDGYTCQECGDRGGTINAHHLKPYKTYKELRYNINNGITMCAPCHVRLHQRIGK